MFSEDKVTVINIPSGGSMVVLFILIGRTFVPSWCPAKLCSFCWEFYEKNPFQKFASSFASPSSPTPFSPCVHVGICILQCVCVWRSGDNLTLWFSFIFTYADTSCLPWGIPVRLAGLQASGDSSVSPSVLPASVLVLQMHMTASSFTWGPQICATSTLPAEPSPTLHVFSQRLNW